MLMVRELHLVSLVLPIMLIMKVILLSDFQYLSPKRRFKADRMRKRFTKGKKRFGGGN
jgi:hypothetical protein